MNLEQLQGMSDQELNELAAILVMKWSRPFNNNGWYYKKEDGEYGYSSYSTEDWNPTNDMNDCFELVKKIPRQYRVEIVYVDSAFLCSIYSNETTLLCLVKSDMPDRAFTIASILAKESE